MQIERVLVVDDEMLMREFLSETLARAGCEVTLASNGTEACRLLAEGKVFDFVMTDIKMEGAGGLEVLAQAKACCPRMLVVLMTAHATLDTALQAMRSGAFDYLTKPITAEQVDVLLSKAAAYRTLLEENRFHRRTALCTDDGFEDIVGRSEPMKAVFKLIEKVASSSATVLVSGESGTGKELVARAIHRRSPRQDKPFIRVNCAALPETLLESELFGHEKGAFTGASERRPGRFELAHTGTLLLDEIGETTLALQSKLLRVLQEREFERVGGTKTLKVDVRVICTSNRDLKKAIAEDLFREDLYYRLNVVPIHMPPLRERAGDLPMLADYLLRKYAERHGKPSAQLTAAVREALCEHTWPGNVRELENAIERGVILNDFSFLPSRKSDLDGMTEHGVKVPYGSAEFASVSEGHDINGTNFLPEVERRVILRTLQQEQGNRTQAARILGLSVRTLYSKLREYEVLDASGAGLLKAAV